MEVEDAEDYSCCDEWLDDPALSMYHFYHAHSGMAPEAPGLMQRLALAMFDGYVSLRLLFYRRKD
jgi:hypothetical protein